MVLNDGIDGTIVVLKPLKEEEGKPELEEFDMWGAFICFEGGGGEGGKGPVVGRMFV